MRMVRSSINAPNPRSHSDFPVLILHVSDGRSKPARFGFQQFHWHNDLQLTVVLRGVIRVDTISRQCMCPAGSSILINTRTVHRITSGKGDGYQSFIFPTHVLNICPTSTFSTSCVDAYTGENSQPLVFFHDSPWASTVCTLARRACAKSSGGKLSNADKYFILSTLISIWSIYLLHARFKPVSARVSILNVRLRRFISYIEDNYSRHLNVRDIAGAANVSETECLRCFNEGLRVTPHRFLVDYRLSKAAQLLADSDLPVSVIAPQVGFSASSALIAAFHKRYGTTPIAFRKEDPGI